MTLLVSQSVSLNSGSSRNSFPFIIFTVSCTNRFNWNYLFFRSEGKDQGSEDQETEDQTFLTQSQPELHRQPVIPEINITETLSQEMVAS